MSSSDLDDTKLLKDLAAALLEARQTLLALRRGDKEDAYFPSDRLRWITSRETLQAVAERKGDPAVPALSGWVFALLLLRANLAAFWDISATRSEKRVRVREPEPAELDLHEVVIRLVADPRRVREDAVTCLAAAGSPLADPVVAAAERAMEIARRAGLAHLDDVYSPLPRAELATLAADFQHRTDDLTKNVLSRGDSLAVVLGRGAALELSLPFPAQLGPRWVLGLFPRETGLFDVPGLSLGALPRAVTGASFARVLARLGARYADATSASEVLPVFASTPAELRRRTFGALFASLFVNQPFLRRALGFNAAEASRASRAFALVYLAAARLAAAKVLSRPALLSGNGDLARESAADQTAQALYTEVPRGLALVLPRPRLTDPGSFLALCLGARLAVRMRESFDDDWFRNPRAFSQLHDELARQEPLTLSAEPAKEGSVLVARSLADLLG